jgi:hypothetical protein
VTVTGLINSLPVDERIQAHNFLTAYDATEAGYRSAPFAKEIPKEAVLLEASIDSHEQPSVEATDWMLQEARKEVVTSELLERMGTDADLPPEPPTTRDAVAAAVEAHGFGDHE